MFTKKDHIKVLAKNIVSRLEQDESIALNPRTRQMVYQDLYTKLSPYIITDEEMREKILAQLGQKAEALEGSEATESEQYKASKAVMMNKLGENAVHGLYYQIPIKNVATLVVQFMMSHNQVEEVYLSDDDLEKSIVDFFKKCNPEQLH